LGWVYNDLGKSVCHICTFTPKALINLKFI